MADLVAVLDQDGNVVALLDLVKGAIRYGGRELPFFLVAGPSEQEYPSYYASALVRARIRKGGGKG